MPYTIATGGHQEGALRVGERKIQSHPRLEAPELAHIKDPTKELPTRDQMSCLMGLLSLTI